MLSIGVVGVGRWGRNHVRVLKELENEGLVKLNLVVDVDPDRVKDISNSFKIPHYSTNIEDVSKYCDAAIVAVPIERLYEVSKILIKDGIHVLIEKPVATSVREVEDLLSSSRHRGIIAMPGFIMRFNPVIEKLKTFLSEYSDNILYILFKRLSRRPMQARRYSILLDLAVHDIDLCMYLSNDRDICLQSFIIDFVDFDEVFLAFIKSKKFPCCIHIDGLSLVKIREVDIIGNNFFIRCDTDSLTISYRYSDGRYLIEGIVGEEPLKREDRMFVLSVQGKDVAIPSLVDALHVLKIIEDVSHRCSLKLVRDSSQ